MSDTPRHIAVRATAAVIAAGAGPASAAYAFALDLGRVFKWVVGAADTPDSVSTLGYSGGVVGAWRRVREPRLGADLVAGNQTIQVGGREVRTMPAATLAGNATVTLGTTNAAEGDRLRVVRLDVGAFTLAIANGGAGGGSLLTMPVSVRYWAEAEFDGTDWNIIGGGTFA